MHPTVLVRRLAALVLALGLGLSLSACNTVAGVGEDVAAVGKATTGAAEQTKEAIKDETKTTP